jgi:hypothetical protein
MTLHTKLRWFCGFILCTLLLASCTASQPQPGTLIWIDVPLNGLSFFDLQPINIKGHATSSDGVSRVEIFINNVLMHTFESLHFQGNLAVFEVSWTPPDLGDYIIAAVAYSGENDPGSSDLAHIRFVQQDESPVETTATDIPLMTTPATANPTAVPPTPATTPEAMVQFWADPPTIQAGSCTTLYWRTQDVQQVIFGGLQQPFEGSYRDCLCESQRYTLTVINLDGNQEKYTVEITVTGTCATPTPSPTPPDTTPPPPPTPYVPANGLVLSCRSTLDLVWTPVEDPSGISEYQVQVQRHAGDNNWQDISGGIFTGIQTKETNIPVECAWYYRWRVRAIDGAGNVSDWSVWFTFTITIG